MKVVFLLSPAKTLNFDRIWVEDDSLECRDETLFPEETGVLLEWLNDHLRILSGFYGLISPLDKIKAYRLEMGSKLETTEGPNLYKFWGTKLTTALMEDLKEGDAVVNTASQEYAKAIDFPMLINQGIKCFECKFLNVGSSCGKRARGAIVRFACEKDVTHVDDLKDFVGTEDIGDYSFVGE